MNKETEYFCIDTIRMRKIDSFDFLANKSLECSTERIPLVGSECITSALVLLKPVN